VNLASSPHELTLWRQAFACRIIGRRSRQLWWQECRLQFSIAQPTRLPLQNATRDKTFQLYANFLASLSISLE
jgi:hypothetical protein